MESQVTLDEVLKLTEKLSLVDKVRLIELIAPQIKHELTSTQNGAPRNVPPQQLRGLWKGTSTSEEELDDARRELWERFPRTDL
jgi:hypothetical protein